MKNMTPAPWTIDDMGHVLGRKLNWSIIDPEDVSESDRRAIVSAINGTYGKGINPDAVEDMLKALEDSVTLSDNNLANIFPGRSPECQAMYDQVVAAIKKAQL